MAFKFSDKNRIINIHNFDKSSGQYLGSQELNIEANTGLPAQATDQPLPELSDKQTAIYQAGAWQALADNRGPIWDQNSKEISEQTEFGPLPAGKTSLAPGEFDLWDGVGWLLDVGAQLLHSKAAGLQSITDYATTCRKTVARAADHYEVGGWPGKEARGERIIAATATTKDIDLVQLEADERGQGETAEQLAVIYLQKAAAYNNALSVITGMNNRAKKSLELADTVEQVAEVLAALKQEAETKLPALIPVA